jgi:hypothetical protein
MPSDGSPLDAKVSVFIFAKNEVDFGERELTR